MFVLELVQVVVVHLLVPVLQHRGPDGDGGGAIEHQGVLLELGLHEVDHHRLFGVTAMGFQHLGQSHGLLHCFLLR